MAKAGIKQIDNVSPTNHGVTLSSDTAHYTAAHILAVQPTVILHQLSVVIGSSGTRAAPGTGLGGGASAAPSQTQCPESGSIQRFSLM